MKRCWLAGRLVGVFRSHSSVAAVLRRFLNDIGTTDGAKTEESGGKGGETVFCVFHQTVRSFGGNYPEVLIAET